MKDDIGELWDLVVAYARQEAWDPMKTLGRWVAFGVAGAVALVIGLSFAVLGVLRLLQDEGGSAFQGHLSWLPYCIATLLAGAAVAASASGIARIRKQESKATRTEGKG